MQRLSANSKYEFDIKNKEICYLHSNIFFQSSSMTENTFYKKTIKIYVNIQPTSAKISRERAYVTVSPVLDFPTNSLTFSKFLVKIKVFRFGVIFDHSCTLLALESKEGFK